MLHDDPPSADEDVARLRLALRNTHLSALVERGILTYDPDEHIVRKGPRFDALGSLSNPPDDHGGEFPDGYL